MSLNLLAPEAVVTAIPFIALVPTAEIESSGKSTRFPMVIRKRGEDGSRVITVRIEETILAELDRIAAESNRSRNELINIILQHGIDNLEIR